VSASSAGQSPTEPADLEAQARALHARDWPDSDWGTLNANSRNAWRRAALAARVPQPPDPEPSARHPWTVTLAWTPDQNWGRVSVMPHRAPVSAVAGLLRAGETHDVVAEEHQIEPREVAVLARLVDDLTEPSEDTARREAGLAASLWHVLDREPGTEQDLIDTVRNLAGGPQLSVLTARDSDEHVYLSTSCLHFDHGYCGGSEGYDAAGDPFPKRPGQCKWCASACVCDCHTSAGGPS
jgi:uncharacterized protein (DUF433 family)